MKTFIYLMPALLASLSSEVMAAQAEVYHDNWNLPEQCYESSYYDYYNNLIEYKFCYDYKGIWHYVNTSSGNTIYLGKGTYEWNNTYTINGVTYYSGSSDEQWKHHVLIKDGEQHLYKTRYNYVHKHEDLNYCVVYSWSSDYQFVNGEVVRSDGDFTADPCS